MRQSVRNPCDEFSKSPITCLIVGNTVFVEIGLLLMLFISWCDSYIFRFTKIGQYSCLIKVDVKNAFSSVRWTHLLHLLAEFVISSDLLGFIDAFLYNRSVFRTQMNIALVFWYHRDHVSGLSSQWWWPMLTETTRYSWGHVMQEVISAPFRIGPYKLHFSDSALLSRASSQSRCRN